MIFSQFNYVRYPFFWDNKTKDILKEQLKYTEFVYAKKTYSEDKGSYKVYYANLPMSFDIEDSSFYNDNNEKVAIMYVWQVGINGIVYMGRTWEQFHELIECVNNYGDSVSDESSDEYRFIIYVHFLDHEFQFIRKRFKWASVFSRKERSPIYAITGHVEFRDSYILTGKSLAKSAEDIRTMPGLKKKVGDLDYRKMRSNRTHLTRKEIGYCMADVQILNVIIMEKMQDEKNNIGHIPLTNTGYVRRYCRQSCYSQRKEHKHEAYIYYTGVHNLTLQPEEYKLLKSAFQGGYTHANPLFVGDHIKGKIDSIDFTSSYPAVLLSNPFPASSGEKVKPKNQQEFEHYLKDYMCLFEIKFVNIKQKADSPDSIISYSKCNHNATVGEVLNNGRVESAKVLVTYVTETDFNMIRAFYEWNSVYIGKMYIYRKGLLPKSIIQVVLDLYKAKTTLKGVAGKEVEYMLKKGMLNSVYGMMVTNIIKPLVLCNESGDWIGEEKKDLVMEIDKYNKDRKRFLFYPWGVWTTSYARRNLMSGILEFGCNDYIYSDTDSIKCLNIEKHMKYINDYNDNIQNRIKKVLISYDIDPEEARPKTIKGEKKPLGVWDIETSDHSYTDFKTLGAKRYMCGDKKSIFITVAGVNKKTGRDFIGTHQDPYDFFSDDMEIPDMYSGKLTHTYIDEERSGVMTDYQGNKSYYHELSCVHLEPAKYHLSVMEQYKEYVRYQKEVKKK